VRYFSILLISICFFAAFSFEYDLPLMNFTIGENDLKLEGVANWLFYEVCVNLFLIFIGCVGFRSKGNNFINRFFLAIIIDGFVSIVRHCVFGYYEPFYMAAVANAIPLSYIIYSYIIYGHRIEQRICVSCYPSIWIPFVVCKILV
jgi:hypothetical protein